MITNFRFGLAKYLLRADSSVIGSLYTQGGLYPLKVTTLLTDVGPCNDTTCDVVEVGAHA